MTACERPAGSNAAIPRWLDDAAGSPLLPWLFFAYVAFFVGMIHFRSEGIWERDGYYHARFAQMLPQTGVSREFPWTQASIWRDRFCDKEFLFHVLMVPFCRDEADPIGGAKAFSTLLVVAFFATLYYVLRAHGARWPLLFAALPLCMGVSWLVRIIYIRSHVLSLLLAVLGMHFLLGRRWRALAALGFVYAWSYMFPYALVAVAVPFVVGRWIGGDSLDWRSVLAAFAGVTAGLIVHPYTPNTLDMFVIVLDNLNSALGSFSPFPRRAVPELGGELRSQTTLAFLAGAPLLCLSVAGLCLAGWSVRKKLSPQALGAVCGALAWFGVTLAYFRLIEYAVPMMAIALALVLRDVLAGVDVRRDFLSPRPVACLALFLGIAALLAALHATATRETHKLAESRDPPRFRGAVSWMDANLEPGETVLNLFWDEFPDLFYDSRRQRYVWALDPSFTARHDMEKTVLLKNAMTRFVLLDPVKLGEAFGARYMAMSSRRAILFGEITSGRLKPVYEDAYGLILPLGRPLGQDPAEEALRAEAARKAKAGRIKRPPGQ